MAFPHGPIRTSLPDGTTVVLRPLSSDDRDRLAKGLEALSERSRFTRFFSAFKQFSQQQLDYLTNVDQKEHVAWGALLGDENPRGVAVGRFARLAEDPETAEVAITVLDEFQGRGIGALLMALLIRTAMHLGVRRLSAFVMRENRGLVETLEALGGQAGTFQDGAVTVDLPIPTSLDDFPDSPTTRRLKEAIEQLGSEGPEESRTGGCEGVKE